MELYRIEEKNMSQIERDQVDREKNLEKRLIRSDSAVIGGTEIMYISRQEVPGDGGVFDILGVDDRGNCVVVELKRDNAPRTVVAQALEYASEVRSHDYAQLDTWHSTFINENEETAASVTSLQKAHQEHFQLAEPLAEDEFNADQRLIIVAAEFEEERLLSTADFLRAHGVDVIVVEYEVFRDNESENEFLTTEAVRRPLDEDPNTGSDSNISDYDREFHLNHQMNQGPSELLSELISLLSEIENLQPPEWGQKPYVRFRDVSGRSLFTIQTQATQFKIRVQSAGEDENEHNEIAERIGIPTDQVSQVTYPSHSPLQIVCDPDDSPDVEQIRNEIETLLFD